MKKRRHILMIAVVLCLLATALAGAYWNAQQEADSLPSSAVDALLPLAEFQGEKVYRSDVENQMRSFSALGMENQKIEKEMLMEILQNMVLYQEAIRLGYAATQSEIDALVTNNKQTYDIPEGKAMIDQYCANADITVDEYFAYLEAQVPRTIARQKLLDAVGKQYCDQHGLTFTKVNPPKEMTDAQDAYVTELFAQAQGEIIYYTDNK